MTTARGPNQGYILVAVLAVMLLLSGLMAAGSMFVRSALHGGHIEDDDRAMAGSARSALEIVAHQLFGAGQSLKSVDERRIRFGSATVYPRIVDEAGKADLNGSDIELLKGVFMTALDRGAAEALAARVALFRGDPPVPAARATLAATGPVSQPQPALRKRHTGFQSLDQARDVMAVSAPVWAALRRKLTVFNPDGKIDIMEADADLLRALPGMPAQAADDIVERRDTTDPANLGTLQAYLGDAIAFAKVKPGPAYTVRLAVTLASGRSKITEAVISESKAPDEPFYILDWQD